VSAVPDDWDEAPLVEADFEHPACDLCLGDGACPKCHGKGTVEMEAPNALAEMRCVARVVVDAFAGAPVNAWQGRALADLDGVLARF
jgi:hypothetical protein